MSEVYAWKETAAQNNSTPPDGAPEGWNPADVNAVVREIMAAVRRDYGAPQWLNLHSGFTVTKESATQVRIAGVDLTSKYIANRRVLLQGGGDTKAFVSSSSYSAPDTIVSLSVDGAAPVPNGTNTALVFLADQLIPSAFIGPGFPNNINTVRVQMGW